MCVLQQVVGFTRPTYAIVIASSYIASDQMYILFIYYLIKSVVYSLSWMNLLLCYTTNNQRILGTESASGSSVQPKICSSFTFPQYSSGEYVKVSTTFWKWGHALTPSVLVRLFWPKCHIIFACIKWDIFSPTLHLRNSHMHSHTHTYMY